MSNWTIKQGDCLKHFAKLTAGSPKLIFVDPPFNIGYEYNEYNDVRKTEDYLGWCDRWLTACYAALHKHGTLWLAIGDEYVSELDIAAKRIGFWKRSHVVWHYTFGVACAKNFARSHTHLLYYTKTKTQFTFNAEDKDLRVASSRQLVYNDSRANPNGKLPDNTWILSPVDVTKAFSAAQDTWLASRVAGTFGERHERGVAGKKRGCPQMPLAVMERIVRACSNPGDLVLDPMSGTFATGDAALRLGRRFLGFDISAAYCKSGAERLKRAIEYGKKVTAKAPAGDSRRSAARAPGRTK